MKRILSNYGAYTAHLTNLSEDASVKSADRCKLKGYCKQWVNGKYLLGCAFFSDLLNACVVLSKVMQHDHLDILQALTSLLQAVKEISTTDLEKWPMYATTEAKCSPDVDGKMEYQCQEINNFSAAKARHCGASAVHVHSHLSCVGVAKPTKNF